MSERFEAETNAAHAQLASFACVEHLVQSSCCIAAYSTARLTCCPRLFRALAVFVHFTRGQLCKRLVSVLCRLLAMLHGDTQAAAAANLIGRVGTTFATTWWRHAEHHQQAHCWCCVTRSVKHAPQRRSVLLKCSLGQTNHVCVVLTLEAMFTFCCGQLAHCELLQDNHCMAVHCSVLRLS